MADPQVNPNALGAPTEGFGQTVTFAFDPRGVTPQLEIPKSVPRQGGASGVSRAQLANPNQAYENPPKPDGTADLLMRVGGAILAPLVERERNTKFVQGIQQAMQGEAVKDMAEREPWYSRIFGDTPAVAGARAYEVGNRVNETVAQETANMDKLKTMNAQDAAKHFAGVMERSMTGDPQSDGMIIKSMADQLPALMKAQAKAHYGHNQRVASDKMSEHIGTAAAALQQNGQLYAEDHMTDEDFALSKQRFVAAIMPPEGINEENYGKVLAANLKKAAALGQFHAIAAVKESGGFAALSPDQQNAVNSAVTAAAKRHRDNYAFNYAGEIAELRSDAQHLPAGMTPREILGRYQKMNAAFTKLTGNPEGLFSSDEMAGGIAGAFNYVKREEAEAVRARQVLADRQASADEKAAAAAQLAGQVDGMIATGDVFLAKIVTKATDDEINLAAYKRFTSDPQKGTDMLRNNFVKWGYVNPILKEQMQGLMRGSEGREAPSTAFMAGVEKYQNMQRGAGSSALASAHFGEYAPRIERFLRMAGDDWQNSPTMADAYATAMGRGPETKAKPLGNKQAAELVQAVSKSGGFSLPRWAGGKITMRPETAEKLAALAEANIEDWRGVGGVGDAEAVRRGIAAALTSRRVEILGGFAIDRALTQEGKTLREAAGDGPDGFTAIPADKADLYFEQFLKSKRGSIAGDRATIKRAGAGNYIVTYVNDGKVDVLTFGEAEWQRFARQATLTDTTKSERNVWVQGPAVDWKADYTRFTAAEAKGKDQAAANSKLKPK